MTAKTPKDMTVEELEALPETRDMATGFHRDQPMFFTDSDGAVWAPKCRDGKWYKERLWGL